jgi:hypothetical protein
MTHHQLRTGSKLGLLLVAAILSVTGVWADHGGSGNESRGSGMYGGGWGQPPPFHGGGRSQGSGLFGGFQLSGQAGDTFKKVARIALTAGGAVIGGLFASQFGTVWTVVGGAVGFLVSRWIANKLFGDSWHHEFPSPYQGWGGPRWSQMYPGQDPGQDPGQFPGPGQFPHPSQNAAGYVEPGWPGGDPGKGGDSKGSGTWNGAGKDLGQLRDDFYESMKDYTESLRRGTEAQKAAAKSDYDRAREAYYRAKLNDGQ